jgi:hypothetical protein
MQTRSYASKLLLIALLFCKLTVSLRTMWLNYGPNFKIIGVHSLQPLIRSLVKGQRAFSCYAFSNMANVKQFSGTGGI